MPIGRHIRTTSSQGGDRKQDRTDATIEVGPIPSGIISDVYSNDLGLTGDDVNFFPMDSGWMHIPHQPVMAERRSGINPAGDAGVPAFSDTLQVKAFSVGDPI